MSNLKLNIPSDILKIHQAFKKSGYKLYVVGGAVRDAILGSNPKDFDLATDAKPDEVLKIAKDNNFSTAEVGKAFGVVIVNGNEIATFRKDIGKGRRPSSVDYTDIEGDVRRRDLTVNALFYDIDKKEIVDLVGGIADLQKKKIRTVGKAEDRFDEDPLRKLRALRFQARLGGTFDKDVLSALQNNPTLNAVSSERIRDEFVKSIKSAKNPQKYMEMNDKIGFTKLILPNLKVNKPYLNDNDYILFLASLLRNNPISFLSKQLNTLNYTNDERVNIVFLVSLQQFKPESIFDYKKLQQKTTLSDEQIKKFGKLIGKDMSKFVNFKLSVGGNDVPNDITGANIGIWIKNKEQENFLREHMEKNKFISEVFKEEIQMLNEGKVLRVFDWDDTLGKSTSYIYVKHKDGKETKLDPAEYAVYNEKPGDTYDFRDFNRMLNNPKIIEKNFKLLQRMLDNPQKKVTILTARKLAFPVRKYLKDTFGMDVYVVALGSNNPQDKADWIEKHIKKGYTDIAFMDDSRKNIAAVDALKSKYPNVRIKTHLVKEHIEEEVQNYLNKLIH
jgi:tRNA nucleotidyltransferase/poly(A) polymerase